jgi:hypothetical protein
LGDLTQKKRGITLNGITRSNCFFVRNKINFNQLKFKIMKTKILALFSIGALTLLIVYSCNITNGSVTTLNNTICSNYTNISTLEVKLVHAMTNKYKDGQLSEINDGTISRFTTIDSDSRAVWLDLETLKAFVYHIESKAKDHPTKPAQSKDLGIRIYYASYPDAPQSYDDLNGVRGSYILPVNYHDRHSIVMIPTIRRGVEEVDFNPLDNDTYYDAFNPAFYAPGSPTPILALSSIPGTGSTGALNHGNLYPPLGDSGLGF